MLKLHSEVGLVKFPLISSSLLINVKATFQFNINVNITFQYIM